MVWKLKNVIGLISLFPISRDHCLLLPDVSALQVMVSYVFNFFVALGGRMELVPVSPLRVG